MRKSRVVLILGVLVVLLMTATTAVASTPENFRTHLTGALEEPPNDSKAQGQAVFQVKKGTELHFKLMVANIENVTAAHIHCGPPGANGPVAVWLYPLDGPPGQEIPGRFDGILARGTRTNDNVIVIEASEVCPGGIANLSDLLDKMRTGQAYVNVHTAQYPAGEIRGDIHSH